MRTYDIYLLLNVQARGHGRHRRRPSRGRSGRSRGLHPVSLNFGRPNIEEFIAETIQGTAVVAEWAGHEGPPPETESRAPPTNLRQVNWIDSNRAAIEACGVGVGGSGYEHTDKVFAVKVCLGACIFRGNCCGAYVCIWSGYELTEIDIVVLQRCDWV